MAGDADRRVLDIIDPGRRQASVKVAGRSLLGADSDEGMSVLPLFKAVPARIYTADSGQRQALLEAVRARYRSLTAMRVQTHFSGCMSLLSFAN